MYSGDEKIILNGKDTQFTILDFWRWALSNIEHNTERGTFADFLVRCALEKEGISTRETLGTGFEPYDLEGPVIESTGEVSRIEVKSAGVLQTWGKSKRISFGISPARVMKKGDVKHKDIPQRNNDLYVFCYYFAEDESANILDMRWWRFYVLGTYQIESDERLSKQRTISLKTVERMCKPLSFDEIAKEICKTCEQIPKNED